VAKTGCRGRPMQINRSPVGAAFKHNDRQKRFNLTN
jgi:hypothetical protein